MFDEDILFTYIGYAAALATILTSTLQILKIIETKNVSSLSSYMYIIYCLGLVCWFAYGVYINSYILLFANLITFMFSFVILILILYYDAEDKIERERRDDITTVYNMKYFQQIIPEKIAQALVSKQNFSLIMLKIDNLAKLRNSTNVKTANKALKQIGAVIEKDLRGSDMIARYNEEKFVIFLSNSDEKGAKVVAGRITDNIKKIQFKISSKDKITFLPIMGACTSKTAKALSDLICGANKAIDEVSPKSKIKIQFCKNK